MNKKVQKILAENTKEHQNCTFLSSVFKTKLEQHFSESEVSFLLQPIKSPFISKHKISFKALCEIAVRTGVLRELTPKGALLFGLQLPENVRNYITVHTLTEIGELDEAIHERNKQEVLEEICDVMLVCSALISSYGIVIPDYVTIDLRESDGTHELNAKILLGTIRRLVHRLRDETGISKKKDGRIINDFLDFFVSVYGNEKVRYMFDKKTFSEEIEVAMINKICKNLYQRVAL
jgi:hypothetical protein